MSRISVKLVLCNREIEREVPGRSNLDFCAEELLQRFELCIDRLIIDCLEQAGALLNGILGREGNPGFDGEVDRLVSEVG